MTPDLIIGPKDRPYMLRWHLFRWRGWQLALHKICRSDDDRALHDHVGNNISFVLWGDYYEVLSHEWETYRERWCWWLGFYFRRAEMPHRIVKLDNGPVWTIWLRWPPRRQWGFHCPKGWRHWREYVTLTDDYYKDGISTVGKGCE
jgi:hypothetical protein